MRSLENLFAEGRRSSVPWARGRRGLGIFFVLFGLAFDFFLF